MEVLIISIILGFIPSIIAYKKGRNLFQWWTSLSFIYYMGINYVNFQYNAFGAIVISFSSIVIISAFALIIKEKKDELDRRKLKNGMKKCPYCAEIIRGEAKVCRFCKKDLSDMDHSNNETVCNESNPIRNIFFTLLPVILMILVVFIIVAISVFRRFLG